MFNLTSRGNYSKTRSFLERLRGGDNFSDLNIYGEMGVTALFRATPVDTGRTANSWDYRITHTGKWVGIEWFNTNQPEKGGPSVAILLQYGHATRNKGYVLGRDYINPAMKPVFDQIVYEVWKKVTA